MICKSAEYYVKWRATRILGNLVLLGSIVMLTSLMVEMNFSAIENTEPLPVAMAGSTIFIFVTMFALLHKKHVPIFSRQDGINLSLCQARNLPVYRRLVPAKRKPIFSRQDRISLLLCQARKLSVYRRLVPTKRKPTSQNSWMFGLQLSNYKKKGVRLGVVKNKTEVAQGKLVLAKRRAVTLRERRFIINRDNHTCRYCSTKLKVKDIHIDHVYPYSRGGETTVANSVVSCRQCNSRKSAKVGTWPKPITHGGVK